MAYPVVTSSCLLIASSVVRRGRGFLSCTRAAIAPMTALMMLPVIGGVAYAVELGSWQYMQRSAQNAADIAALAAASVNSGGGSSTAESEARAAAAEFGFVDGQNSATVDADITACPAGLIGTPVCYEAIITTTVPLTFSRMLDFSGTDGSNQLISARAVAVSNGGAGGGGTSFNPCLWALGSSGVTLAGDGIPAANLDGCGVMSAGSINCNGSGTMNADYALSGNGTSTGCADPEDGENIEPGDPNWVPLPPDPYASLPIPSVASCGKNPPANNLSADSAATLIKYCGDVKLTKNINLTGSNAVLVISNGTLDLNGFELKTSGANASTTIIFTGTNDSDRQHYPTSSKAKSGTLSIKAPISGTYANIALMQDGVLLNHTYGGNKNTINFTYAGNEPTWNISGVAYFPKAFTEFRGVIGKYETNGTCFVLIANSISISGTGEVIADNTTEDCEDSGYSIPGVTIPGSGTRPKLVR